MSKMCAFHICCVSLYLKVNPHIKVDNNQLTIPVMPCPGPSRQLLRAGCCFMQIFPFLHFDYDHSFSGCIVSSPVYNGNEFSTGWSRQTLQYACTEAGSVLARLTAERQQALALGLRLEVVHEVGEEEEEDEEDVEEGQAEAGEKHKKETQEKGTCKFADKIY